MIATDTEVTDTFITDEPSIISIAAHLCDRCGTVRSKAMLVNDGKVFTFCGHHLRRYAPALIGSGFNLYDPLNELSFGNQQNRLQGSHN